MRAVTVAQCVVPEESRGIFLSLPIVYAHTHTHTERDIRYDDDGGGGGT